MLKCAHCPNIAHAVRNGIALCVPHYREARQIMTREEPCYANCEYCTTCIPMHDTPIYAAMVRLVTTADRLAKEHPNLPTLPPRKPLLKNRKTRR